MSSDFQVTVEYFAAARELCDCSQEALPLARSSMPAAEVLSLLSQRHARLAPVLSRMRLAINDELVDADATVVAGDRLAVLPPVAGGAPGPEDGAAGSRGDERADGSAGVTLCAVRDTPLSVDEVMAAIAHGGAGGITLFVGCVRDHADGKSVARLDYEAHPTMAHKELSAVLAQVARAHPGTRLAATHRVGELGVGDLAVVVGASAAHRAEAFDACRQAIEVLKERVPIWKKEWAPDGSANWVNL